MYVIHVLNALVPSKENIKDTKEVMRSSNSKNNRQ
jgi:hypothetical protein